MYLDKKNHTGTLIGSLNKAFKSAKRKGTYSVRDLYFLHCIYRTVKYACEIGTTEIQQKELVAFYFKILSSSNNFCVHEFESAYYKSEQPNELYVQSKDNTSTSAPVVSNFTLIDSGEEKVVFTPGDAR